MFGDDYPTPDGTCLRDYIHVTDLAEAHVLALDALEAGPASAVYNLGNGRPFSVREVIAGGRARDRPAGAAQPWRRGGRATRRSSTRRATAIQAELGWAPRFEDLDTIVDTAWRWRQAHPHGYQGPPGMSATDRQACEACLADPLLSVVMPVYNERETIEEIIRRVLAVPVRIELIVVDDGSTDGTREILAALQARARVRSWCCRSGTGARARRCGGASTR